MKYILTQKKFGWSTWNRMLRHFVLLLLIPPTTTIQALATTIQNTVATTELWVSASHYRDASTEYVALPSPIWDATQLSREAAITDKINLSLVASTQPLIATKLSVDTTTSPVGINITFATPAQAASATIQTLKPFSPLNVRQLTFANHTQTAYAINLTLNTTSTALVFPNLTFINSIQSPFTSKVQHSPNSPGQIEPKTTNSTPEASTQQTRLISAKRPLVVATTGFIADMATQIAGDACEVVALLPPGTDPHTYEAVPGDAALLSRADLIIENGLTLEGWLGKLIRNTGRKALLVTATHGITPIRNADHAGSVDPHAWMDPVLGRTYARNICEALVSLLPDKREELERRWNEYDRQIKETDEYIS